MSQNSADATGSEYDLDSGGEFLKHLIMNKFENKKEAEEILNKWKNEKVNIGFIGERGCGKSNLINTLRGLCPSDEGAADIDVNECTAKPTPYLHPNNSNIILWDLPGVSPNFPQETYLQDISTKIDLIPGEFANITAPIKYDCFVICCVEGFQESDLKLAKQIAQKSINYYFVRTKMDIHLTNHQRKLQRKLDDSELDDFIEYAKHDIKITLARENLPNRYIFAVSSLLSKFENLDYRNSFEFPQFQNELISNLPNKEKKNALILSLFPLAKEGYEMKFDVLRKRATFVSVLSGVGGLSPIPGTSLAIDMSIMVEEVFFYIKTLNLTEDSFKEIASSFGISYDDLKRDVIEKNKFLIGILGLTANFGKIFLKETIVTLSKALSASLTSLILQLCTKYVATNSVEEFLKTTLPIVFPGIGFAISSLLGAGMSFGMTYTSLNSILDELKKTIYEMLDYCNRKRSH